MSSLKTFTSARDHVPIAAVNVLEVFYDWPVFRVHDWPVLGVHRGMIANLTNTIGSSLVKTIRDQPLRSDARVTISAVYPF